MALVSSLLSFLFFQTSCIANPIPSSELFKSETYSNFKLSPDGKYVSMHFRDKKHQYISLIERSSNKMITSIPFAYDYRLESYHWLNDKAIFFSFNKANIIGKYEDGEFKFHKIKTKGYLVDSFEDDPNKVMFARRYVYNFVNYSLYLIDIEELIEGDFDNANKIKHDLDKVSYYDYDPKSKKVITRVMDEKEESVTIKYMPLKGGKWKDIITLKKTDYKLRVFSFLSNNTVAVITNKDTDKMVLREFNILTQQLGDIIYQHPRYDLTSVGFTNEGVLDYVGYSENGLYKQLFFNKGKDEIRKRFSMTFKNKEAYLIDSTQDKQLSILYVNGADEPGEYFIYENRSNILHRLDASFPNLVGRTFSPTRLLKVKVNDGTEIEAFLTLPQGIDHSTLLVMPHGGPISVKESDRFNKEIQYYASRGFAVLRVNFRGSSGFGKAFQNRGVGEFGKLIEEDITAVVDSVTQTYQFKHMCSIGASYGGYSAAMLAIKHPEKYDCVISSFGIFDLPLLFNASNYRSDEEYRERVAKTVGEFNEGMKEQSPVYLYKNLKAPILLIAGRKDDTADFEHSNRFNYVLKKVGHPVESYFYEDTRHTHKSWSGFRHESAVTYDFLMRTLKLSNKGLTLEGKQAIGSDYAIIADKYNFDDEIENDSEKAVEYYIKASEYDEPRANFNVGSYYHRGEVLKFDMEKAIEYYQRAAKLKYADAYSRLGKFYMEGEYLTKDWNKALEHLTKAQELDANPENNVMFARFYCTAPKEFRNIERCIELMKGDQYRRQSLSVLKIAREKVRKALPWIVIDGNLTTAEKEMLKSYVKEAFALKQIEFELEDIESGTFKFQESERFGRAGKYIVINESNNVKVSDNEDEKSGFGIQFDTDVPGIDLYKDKMALVYRWSRKVNDEEVKIENNYMLYGSPKGSWRITYPLQDIEESAIWTLQVYDLNGKQLYEKEFHVSKLNSSLGSR